MSPPTGPRWTRRRFLGTAAALPAALAVGCGGESDGGSGGSPGDRQDRETPAEQADGISYGDDPNQFGHLALPEDVGRGLRPVVVLVHGGFWLDTYGLSLMDALVNDVISRGWASWNLEYRRVGQDGGGWPGTFQDVADGIDHLVDLADEHRLDLDRVVAVGHSAGGHLATWAAARPGLPDDAPGAGPRVVPVAAVSQAGVLDLVRAADDGLGGGAVASLMGGPPEDHPDRYEVGSPFARLPLGVPVRCVHGRQDGNVPFSQSEDFVARATAAGDDGTVLAPFEGDHFAVLDPTDVSWADTVPWITERFAG